jgi:hypothetical protein
VHHDFPVIFRDLSEIDLTDISEETIQILSEPFSHRSLFLRPSHR